MDIVNEINNGSFEKFIVSVTFTFASNTKFSFTSSCSDFKLLKIT